MFGPERSFILVANVYDCPYPNNVRTAKDGGTQQDTNPVIIEQYDTCVNDMYGSQNGC